MGTPTERSGRRRDAGRTGSAAEGPEQALRARIKALEQRLAERTRMLKLLEETAAAANEGHTVEETIRFAVERLADHTGWPLGHVYWVDGQVPEEARPGDIWIARGDDRFARFRQLTLQTRFGDGRGLIGQVIESAGVVSIRDVREDPRFIRRNEDGVLGVVGAIGFPILVGRDVVAVVEFFSPAPIEPDDLLVELLGNVGTQLGRVVERARAEWQLADAVLAQQRLTMQELHDGLGQELTGLGLLAGSLLRRLESGPHAEQREMAERLVAGLQHALSEIRLIARGLHPVDAETNDLATALEALVADVRDKTGVDCRCECDPARLDDNATATHLFRIAQEALNNAVKHSRAEHVVVELRRRPADLVLSIHDDGVGLDESRPGGGAGLRTMQYRARLIGARLEIGPGTDGGTTVVCTLRLPERPPGKS